MGEGIGKQQSICNVHMPFLHTHNVGEGRGGEGRGGEPLLHTHTSDMESWLYDTEPR